MILHKIYAIIKNLHEDGQKITLRVINNLVATQKIEDKVLAAAILQGWAIDDKLYSVR